MLRDYLKDPDSVSSLFLLSFLPNFALEQCISYLSLDVSLLAFLAELKAQKRTGSAVRWPCVSVWITY